MYIAQSVFAAQVVLGAVVRFPAEADCDARGIVTHCEEPICCKADTEMSAAVAADPVLVVICPVIEAVAVVPDCATRGTFPRAFPGCTPVTTAAPYET